MKGSIVLNGNIRFEVDYVHKFRDKLLSTIHKDPQVQETKKVLLITAAWKRHEYHESHVKSAIREIGIPSLYDENGYDVNIQNLAVYHEFNRFRKLEPEIYKLYHEKQLNIQSIKEFYRRKNDSLVKLLKDQRKMIKMKFPGARFPQMMAYNVEEEFKNMVEKTPEQHLFHYWCRDIQNTLKSIVDNDDRMVEIGREIDDYFFQKSRVEENSTYQRIKKMLEERILSSNSIFIFGGNVAVLLNRLNFFKLKDAFRMALKNGTNFYTVSAGADVLCEKIILYGWVDIENPDPQSDFEFFDNGFGLITKMTIFPHCHDRIKQDDPENLSYLAYRFGKEHLCVGLDQLSFLQLETYRDQQGELYERFVSVGREEPVYIFDRSGRRIEKHFGEELEVPGSKLYESKKSPWV